jgi:hypothetical protein
MVTTATSTEPAPCPPLSELQKAIQALEDKTKQQDQSDARIQLAALTKIGSEVEQAKAKYKQEYESLKFAFQQSSDYEKLRAPQIDAKVPAAEKAIIKRILDCTDQQIAHLKDVWTKVRDQIPGLTSAFLTAQNYLADAEEPYHQALAYRTNQNEMDALQVRSTKEIEAQNFRGAYFLVELDMKPKLTTVKSPAQFNTELETEALDYYKLQDSARVAKTALDQATADLQKKKKAYDDAKAKRNDNILKQIAEESFPVAPSGAAASESQSGSTSTSTEPRTSTPG